MIDIVICDDDKNCRNSIDKIVTDFFKEKNTSICTKLYEDYNDNFIKDISQGVKKIYILDIETPTRSGIDVARMIRKRDVESIIIFVTGYEDCAKLVLKKNIMCLSFINKFENLKNSLRESLKEALYFYENDKVIRITECNVTYNIRLNNILYITRDSLDRRTIVQCDKTEYKFKMSLAEVKNLLGDSFIQTHRSCYVNENRIETVDYKNKMITFDNLVTIDLLSENYGKVLI